MLFLETQFTERKVPMKRIKLNPSLLTGLAAVSGLAMGASIAMAAHPPVTLYTYEEVAQQYGMAKMPVMVQTGDATRKAFPYSPKQTCGTAGCHVKNGVDYTYDKISDHAYHSAQGINQYLDTKTAAATGNFVATTQGEFDANKPKPWTQSGAMFGKW